MHLGNLSKFYPLVMRSSLGFVFAWFGISEILNPIYFSGYVPSYISNFSFYNPTIFIGGHGILLFILSICLIFNIFIKISGALAILMLFQIIFGLLADPAQGFNEITVRDVGLLGLALSIWLYAFSKKKKEQ